MYMMDVCGQLNRGKFPKGVIIMKFLIRVCLVLSLFSIIGCYKNEPAGTTQQQQTVQQPVTVTNPLANTTWVLADAFGGIGSSIDVSERMTLDFGETSFRLGIKTISSGITFDDDAIIGTYKKSGDTITLYSSNGNEISGIVIGNSISFDGQEFRRVQ